MIDASDLNVHTEELDGVVQVTAQGDIDLSTTADLRTVLEKVCASRTEPANLVVDIREVTFIDSAGLALLVEVRKRFVDQCRLVLLIAKGSQPERVLRLGRFETFLRICYTPEEAKAAT